MEAAGLALFHGGAFCQSAAADRELEVLVTSLLDEAAYPTQEFLTVYDKRWKQETYYGMLKGRLDLENWSGQSAEAVRQWVGDLARGQTGDPATGVEIALEIVTV